jgi:trans-aconitate 2-methyltransferase
VSERKAFLAEYTARIVASYLPQQDGKVLCSFRGCSLWRFAKGG